MLFGLHCRYLIRDVVGRLLNVEQLPQLIYFGFVFAAIKLKWKHPSGPLCIGILVYSIWKYKSVIIFAGKSGNGGYWNLRKLFQTHCVADIK